MRAAGFVAAALLILAGGILGRIAVIAMRRSEGVFVPAAYVALLCLIAGGLLLRALATR